MKTNKQLLLYFILIFNVVSLSAQDKVVWDSNSLTPNGIFINDTLLCDRTEISNIFWHEFLHYEMTSKGEKSVEYKSLLPDTAGYLFTLPIIANGDTLHFQLSKGSYYNSYYDFPLTGVTLEQAKKYCAWRSDRVLEMILVQKGLIKPNRVGKDNFTIDRFLIEDKFEKHRKSISHYPKYFIADSEDWNLIRQLISEKSIKVNKINSRNNFTAHLNKTGFPLHKVDLEEKNQNDIIYNLLGNVSELIDGENQCTGGSIQDDEKEILKMKINKCQLPDKFVGFRCLSKWVKI